MISACFNYIFYKIKESLPEDPMKGTFNVLKVMFILLKFKCARCTCA